MRDLGSPVHSRRFFHAMLSPRCPAPRACWWCGIVTRRAVGAAVCLFFRDTIMVPWVSSLRDAFALCPNFVLYWEVIRHGCREGYRTLDLGRSFRNAGTFEFKRQWGAQPHTLPWIFVDAAPGARPSVDRDASRFDLLIRALEAPAGAGRQRARARGSGGACRIERQRLDRDPELSAPRRPAARRWRRRAPSAIPCEILAVDNASTDGSAEMVRDEFPDVRLVHLPENIAAAARNVGVAAAKGDIVVTLDNDVRFTHARRRDGGPPRVRAPSRARPW